MLVSLYRGQLPLDICLWTSIESTSRCCERCERATPLWPPFDRRKCILFEDPAIICLQGGSLWMWVFNHRHRPIVSRRVFGDAIANHRVRFHYILTNLAITEKRNEMATQGHSYCKSCKDFFHRWYAAFVRERHEKCWTTIPTFASSMIMR